MKPATLQLEVTYSCNNDCDFCYNKLFSQDDNLLSYERLKEVIVDAKKYGIFSINLNGGEPLLYPYFFELAEFIYNLGIDIHCNTNATLIDNRVAERLSSFFSAICTSIHGATAELHDLLVGRSGAFEQTIAGISCLKRNGVYVAVNVTLSKKNINNLYEILCLLRDINIQTVLLTRVLTKNVDYALYDRDFLVAIKQLQHFQDVEKCFKRIALPQPFPICKCQEPTLKDFVFEHNIPCVAGMLTARISPSGIVTPCPVMDSPIIGNVKDDLFSHIWDNFEKKGWEKSKPCDQCGDCKYLRGCGGGCLQQEDSGVLI